MQTDTGSGSSALLSALSWWNRSGSFDSCPQNKRHILSRRNSLLAYNYEACHNSKGHLRGNEPEPINVGCEQWIQQPEDRVKQPRPQNGGN